jgi:glucose uptake protein
MYAPDTYAAALVLMLTSMVCWGSWPNFLKLLPGWRIEYFYLDYSLGFLITAFLYGVTLGAGDPGFLELLGEAGQREAWMAIVGGFIWNIGNILLLYAIMMAGLAVAFPIAAIPAIVIGIGVSYYMAPVGNPLFLGASILLLLIAAQTTAAAYRSLGQSVAAGRYKGLFTALVAGLLIGFFPVFVTAAITGPNKLDSYTVSFLFTAGAFVATLVAVPVLIRRPLVGEPGQLRGYLQGKPMWHVFGLLAGAV